MKKIIPFVIIAAMMLALNVSERNQPQDKLYISGISVEAFDGDLYSFCISTIEVGDEEDSLKYVYLYTEAASIADALKKIDKIDGRKAVMTMCKYLVLSDGLTVTQFRDILDAFLNDIDITPKLAVFRATGEISQYLSDNQVDTQDILQISQDIQTLPDVINTGKIYNLFVIERGRLVCIKDSVVI